MNLQTRPSGAGEERFHFYDHRLRTGKPLINDPASVVKILARPHPAVLMRSTTFLFDEDQLRHRLPTR